MNKNQKEISSASPPCFNKTSTCNKIHFRQAKESTSPATISGFLNQESQNFADFSVPFLITTLTVINSIAARAPRLIAVDGKCFVS